VTLLFAWILGGLIAALLVPIGVFFVEVGFALADRGASVLPPSATAPARPRVAVLMPAHNEASIIALTLRSVMPQLETGDRLLVVADNCSDATAGIARAEGALVILRESATLRGKGYALDFGVRHLAADAPEVVIVVDADCELAPGTVDRLARLAVEAMRPVQALYLMHGAADAGLKMKIAEFAYAVKNRVRPLGLRRLGLPCQLMGTGMAFPWECVRDAALATGHIAEDLKLGLDLARAGHAPIFCPEARVTSTFAATTEGGNTQRTRWEHGHLALILSDAPRIFLTSLWRFDVNLLALALDLSVPPLALLTLATLLAWLASAVLYLGAQVTVPLQMASVAMLLLAGAVLAAWGRYGRGIISLANLGLAVVYVFVKIPLYARFLVARQMDWVRSKRDDE
jgi:cellulose synthase/poly-beta-1,6-N-acetylglucosamine synthase-like glycosyltransferase